MVLLRNNSFDNVYLCGHVNECILCAAQLFSGLTSEQVCHTRGLLAKHSCRPREFSRRRSHPCYRKQNAHRRSLPVEKRNTPGREQRSGRYGRYGGRPSGKTCSSLPCLLPFQNGSDAPSGGCQPGRNRCAVLTRYHRRPAISWALSPPSSSRAPPAASWPHSPSRSRSN